MSHPKNWTNSIVPGDSREFLNRLVEFARHAIRKKAAALAREVF